MNKPSRVAKGVPTGGEFATEAKGENGDLTVDAPSVEERLARTEKALAEIYRQASQEYMGGNDEYGGAYGSGHDAAMESVRNTFHDHDLEDWAKEYLVSDINRRGSDAMVMFLTGDDAQKGEAVTTLTHLQRMGFDPTKGGARTVPYPAALLQTGDRFTTRKGVSGRVLASDGGWATIRYQDDSNIWLHQIELARAEGLTTTLHERGVEVPAAYHVAAVARDLEKANKALLPWRVTGDDGFVGVSPDAPKALLDHYRSIRVNGAALGVL